MEPLAQVTRTRKYTALELLKLAFPDGVSLETGKELDHVITAEDLAMNPELEADVKVGDTVQIPEMDVYPVEKVLGKYRIVIGGIQGIVTGDRKIIVDSTGHLDVSVGNTSSVLEIVEPE